MPTCRLIIWLLSAWFGALAGCQSPPKKTTSPTGSHPGLISQAGPSSALSKIIRSYDSGRFQDAYTGALSLVRSSSGRRQEEARYMAGLSAFRLNKDEEAKRHLAPLVHNPNRRIAGTSNVTLGLIHQKQGAHEPARARFAAATGLLQGEDGARAHYHLGLSLDGLGQGNSAKIHYRMAIQKSGIESFKQKVRTRLGSPTSNRPPVARGAFTLQFGAFSTHARAANRQKQVEPMMRRIGQGQVRIVQRTAANGRTLYMVQAGNFASRSAAASARSRIGSKDSTVVPNRP